MSEETLSVQACEVNTEEEASDSLTPDKIDGIVRDVARESGIDVSRVSVLCGKSFGIISDAEERLVVTRPPTAGLESVSPQRFRSSMFHEFAHARFSFLDSAVWDIVVSDWRQRTGLLLETQDLSFCHDVYNVYEDVLIDLLLLDERQELLECYVEKYLSFLEGSLDRDRVGLAEANYICAATLGLITIFRRFGENIDSNLHARYSELSPRAEAFMSSIPELEVFAYQTFYGNPRSILSPIVRMWTDERTLFMQSCGIFDADPMERRIRLTFGDGYRLLLMKKEMQSSTENPQYFPPEIVDLELPCFDPSKEDREIQMPSTFDDLNQGVADHSGSSIEMSEAIYRENALQIKKGSMELVGAITTMLEIVRGQRFAQANQPRRFGSRIAPGGVSRLFADGKAFEGKGPEEKRFCEIVIVDRSGSLRETDRKTQMPSYFGLDYFSYALLEALKLKISHPDQLRVIQFSGFARMEDHVPEIFDFPSWTTNAYDALKMARDSLIGNLKYRVWMVTDGGFDEEVKNLEDELVADHGCEFICIGIGEWSRVVERNCRNGYWIENRDAVPGRFVEIMMERMGRF